MFKKMSLRCGRPHSRRILGRLLFLRVKENSNGGSYTLAWATRTPRFAAIFGALITLDWFRFCSPMHMQCTHRRRSRIMQAVMILQVDLIGID